MESFRVTIFMLSIIFGIVLIEGQKDHGEACSLRSQIASFFGSSSTEGCISAKGLVCLNHKCTCMDPTNVYEVPEPSGSSSTTDDISNAASKASSFLKNLIRGSTTTTTTTAAPTPAATGGVTGGKCVGRAGSPCFTQNSTCVAHASCEGAPRICKCQGIYGSNAQGRCSKTSNVVNQVIKGTIG